MNSTYQSSPRNPNPAKPIRAYNTNQAGRGGDQSSRYHAKAGWEGIDAARARSQDIVNPSQQISDLMASLRTRVTDIQAWMHDAPSPKMVKTWKQGTHERVKKIRALLAQYTGADVAILREELEQIVGN